MARVKRGMAIPREPEGRGNSGKPDYILLAMVIGLAAFGLLMVYDASVVVAATQFGNKFYFLQQQAENLLIGLAALFVTAKIDYHLWKRLALPILLVGLALLFAVMIPGLGVTVLGAKRWLNVGVTQIQPSYLLSVALVIYLARWFADGGAERRTLKGGFIPFCVLMGLVLGVVAGLQRDLGTSIILAFTSIAVYFLAGVPWRHLMLLPPLGGLAGVGLILAEPYRLKRLFTFTNKSQDVLGASYHINQVMIALGSGGWFGVGLGQSRQKYDYVPEVQTDSIFAILGEELGYIGALALVGAMIYLLWRGFKVAMNAPDMFGRLLAGGIMALLGVQTFINLFAMAAIIPLTGIPLPFISNGGTSLIVLLASMGIVLNISKQVETKPS